MTQIDPYVWFEMGSDVDTLDEDLMIAIKKIVSPHIGNSRIFVDAKLSAKYDGGFSEDVKEAITAGMDLLVDLHDIDGIDTWKMKIQEYKNESSDHDGDFLMSAYDILAPDE